MIIGMSDVAILDEVEHRLAQFKHQSPIVICPSSEVSLPGFDEMLLLNESNGSHTGMVYVGRVIRNEIANNHRGIVN